MFLDHSPVGDNEAEDKTGQLECYKTPSYFRPASLAVPHRDGRGIDAYVASVNYVHMLACEAVLILPMPKPDTTLPTII